MPSKNRTKGIYATWDEVMLKKAVRSVLVEGMSKKKASQLFGIPRPTLIRHVQKASLGGGVEKRLGRPTVLTVEQELELVSRILQMESRLYGMTTDDVRSVVYSFCEKNNIPNPFSKKNKRAGHDWMSSFLSRHEELALRKPEAVSIQRAAGFNKAKVDMFYQLLQSLLFDEKGQQQIPPENIFNVDESG